MSVTNNSRKIRKELSNNDLRCKLNEQKKKSKKSNENSLKSDAEISCQARVRNLSLKETIQISLGIIKKPRKLFPGEKFSSTTSQKVGIGKKNFSNLPEDEKLCHKEFFILPAERNEESLTNLTSSTTSHSSKLQRRLKKLREEPVSLSQAPQDVQQEYKCHDLDPEVEEFIPSTSSVSSTSSSQPSHIQQYYEKLSNEDVKRISLGKLTRDQQLGLLAVTALKSKYFQDNFEYFVEYYDIIGEFLNIDAVCDFLNASGISFSLPEQRANCNYYC